MPGKILSRLNFYPASFEIKNHGRHLRVDFQVAKLLYLEEKAMGLTLSDNPFAFVTKAHMEVQRRSGKAKEGPKNAELC